LLDLEQDCWNHFEEQNYLRQLLTVPVQCHLRMFLILFLRMVCAVLMITLSC